MPRKSQGFLSIAGILAVRIYLLWLSTEQKTNPLVPQVKPIYAFSFHPVALASLSSFNSGDQQKEETYFFIDITKAEQKVIA